MAAQVATKKKSKKRLETPSAGVAWRVRPLHDRVLLRRIEEPNQVRGGIVIPDTAKERPQEAEVIAVGPGKLDENLRRQPMDVRPGDHVLIGKHAGTDIKIDEENFVFLRADDILAVTREAS